MQKQLRDVQRYDITVLSVSVALGLKMALDRFLRMGEAPFLLFCFALFHPSSAIRGNRPARCFCCEAIGKEFVGDSTNGRTH